MKKSLLQLQTLFCKITAKKHYKSFYCAAITMMLLATGWQAVAQAPTISYAGPQTYTAGTAITPLVPTSTNVAAVSYNGGSVAVNSSTFPESFFQIGSGNSNIYPEAVTADVAGNLYLGVGSLVVKCNSSGTYLATLANLGTNTQIREMVLDAAGNIYVTALNRATVFEVRVSDGALINRGTGIVNPWGMAVDASGDIYVSDNITSESYTIKKILAGSDSTVNVLNVSLAFYIGLDAAGNLYYTGVNTYSTPTLNKLAVGASTPTQLDYISSPTAMVVDASGNAYVASQGDQHAIITMYPANGGSSIGVGNDNVLGNGINLGLDVKGNVYVADDLNGQTIKESPNGGFFPGALPAGLSFDNNTGTFSGTPTAGGMPANYPVYAYNTTGNAVADVNITVLTANDSLSNLYVGNGNLSPAFTSATTAYTSTTVADTVSSINITPVSSDPSSTVTINGTAVTSGLPESLPLAQGINVFTIVVTSTNNSTDTYTLTTIRTALPATVSYAGPQKYTIGTAVTPLLPTSTNPGTFGLYLTKQAGIGSGYSMPSGVAPDNAGNLYVADYGSGQVLKVPVTGGTPVAVGSGFVHPQGLALDSAGNVYVVDGGNNLVKKILAGTNTTVTIGTDYTFGAPKAIAVDVKGNVFVADYQNKNIVEIHADASATSVYASTSNGSSAFVALSGIAVDGTGNVYVSDSSVSQITEIPAGGGTPKLLTPSFSSPGALSADAAGDLFVGDANGIKMIPAGGGTSVALSNYSVSSLSVDGAGDLYTATKSASTIAEIRPTGGYFINKPLPAGLNFDYSTGNISGTPAARSTATNYTVTLNNYSHSATGNVNISVGSGNTALANLAISSGTLSPAFDAGTTNYTATVPYAVSSINLTPTTSDTTEVVSVNGTTVASGTAVNIPLVEGDNTITTLVKAQDSVSTRTYTIVLTRTVTLATLANITPGAGSLSPAFDSNTTSYSLSENNALDSVAFTVLPVDTGATVVVTTTNNSATVTGNGRLYAIPLNTATRTNTGNTPVSIVVTAVDGTNKKEYDVNINQVLSSDASLSNLTVTNFSFYQSFSPSNYYYSSEGVQYAVSSTDVTPTTNDPTATVTVNGTLTPSGTAVNVPLAEGDNTITIVVTAQDGSQQTYTGTVHRYPAVATLQELAGNGSLSPSYDQSVHNYTLSIANYLTSTYLIVFPQDTNATVSVVTTQNGSTLQRGTNFEYTVNLSGSGAIRTGDTIKVPVLVTITSADGNSNEVYNVVVAKTLSADATLEQLQFADSGNFSIGLSPSFDPGTSTYTASVPYSTSSVIISPIANDGTAAITVNGTPVARFASDTIPINEGNNVITTFVTAQDSIATKTYTTTITRQSPPVTISAVAVQSGTLSPTFNPDSTFYNIQSVDHTLTSFNIRITPTDPAATVTVTTTNNNTVVPTAGAYYYYVNLNSATSKLVGGNIVTPLSVVVTAQDGSQKEYNFNIDQQPGTDASVTGLSVSYGFLSPSFSTTTHNYTATRTDASVTSETITVYTTDPTASVTIGSVTQLAGYSGAQFNVPLVSGNNTVNVLVTAQDGTTTQTYTILIPDGPADVTLSAITSNPGTLSPAFNPNTTGYTVSAPSTATSVDLTAIATDTTSIVTVNTSYDNANITGANHVYTINFSSANSYTGSGNSTTPVNIVVKASDNSSSQSYTLNIQRAVSSNDTLSAIVFGTGVLNQTFDPGTTSYILTLPYGATSVDVTPTAQDPAAAITIDGSPVTSGTLVNEAVSPGGSWLYIQVTAPDGSTKNYSIFAFQGPASATLTNLTLSTGTLSPSFDTNNFGYYFASVNGSVSSIAITPTATDPAAIISINGIPASSGTATNVPLSGGSNYISVVVTGEDNIYTNTYYLIVQRAPSDVSLANLTLNNIALTPPFDPNNTYYQVSVPNSIAATTITPTTTDPNATVTVNGNALVSGSAKVHLVTGYNNINIIVTGQDGTTQQYYTVGVVRANASQLSNLTINAGTLNPSFYPADTSYTTSVPYTASSISVTPFADKTATITVNGTPATSGTPVNVNLSVGNNTITTVVTGPGNNTYTYRLTVTRLIALPVISYSSDQTYYKGVTITPLAPSVTGTLGLGYNNSFARIDSTSFPNLSGITRDTAGNVYIINASPGKIYKIPAGTSNHVLLKSIANPTAIASDASGNLYVGFENGIKMIPADGSPMHNIGIVPGGVNGITLDAGGDIYFTHGSGVFELPAGSTNTTKPKLISNKFYFPYGIAVDVSGNLYIADAYYSLMEIAVGSTRPIVVNDNIFRPNSVTIDKNGNIFAGGFGQIQEIPANGGNVITTLVYPFNGPGSTVVLGMTADSKNGLYVAESTNGQGMIDKIGLGSYSISPALPRGLVFDNITGIISGTPSMLSPRTNYIVTAGNAGGLDTAMVSIRVAGNKALISMSDIGERTYGIPDIDPGATSTNDEVPITYTSSNPSVATIIDNKVHIVGIGSTVITASQAGSLEYLPAENRTSMLIVDPALANQASLTDDGIVVHQAVSPNGDGINDVLTIDGLQKYTDNQLSIINNSGVLVYSVKNYDNVNRVFDGHSNKTGAMLQPGTYFYLLEYKDGEKNKSKTGYIILKY